MTASFAAIDKLHKAVIYGNVDKIETLVRSGVSADALAGCQRRPLHLAARMGRIGVIETLFRLGCREINALDEAGWSPIYYAAHYGQVLAIETLVRHGSKTIDTPSHCCRTPMHGAAHWGQPKAIHMLLRLGSKAADYYDLSNFTPLTVAMIQGHEECVKLLRAVGSPDSIPFTDQQRKLMYAPLTGEYVLEVRYGVYFDDSLAQRLLFELDRQENLEMLKQPFVLDPPVQTTRTCLLS